MTVTDAIWNVIKQRERRVRSWDYAERELIRSWKAGEALAPYQEVCFPLRPEIGPGSSVLLFKPDEIGDAVYSLPAIRELCSRFAGTKFFLICSPTAQPLFERTRLFDEISAVEPVNTFGRFPRINLRKALHPLSCRLFDVAIFLRSYPALFRSFRKLPARNLVHPDDPRMPSKSIHRVPVSLWGTRRKHQVLQNLEIATYLTLKNYGFRDVVFPKFYWTKNDERAIDLTFGKVPADPYIVIQPYARYETRQYPIEYWRELVLKLAQRWPLPLVIVGGRDDKPIDGLSCGIQMQGKLDLGQLGYLMSRSAAVLGSLTGPTHWAASMDIPTIVFFSGHSLVTEWGPLGKSLILKTDVPCAPCHSRSCLRSDLICLKELTVERVLPKIEEFLLPLLNPMSSPEKTTRPELFPEPPQIS